jgi:hypothetical protein
MGHLLARLAAAERRLEELLALIRDLRLMQLATEEENRRLRGL